MDKTRTVTVNGGETRPKSVLFCGNCGFDSHIEDEWIMHERRGSRSIWYQCPDCGRSVSVRPSETLDETEFPLPMSTSAWCEDFTSPFKPDPDLVEDLWCTYRDVTTLWMNPWRERKEA